MSAMDLSRLQRAETANVSGKRILYRADLNVPMDDGSVSDATRIERVLPALRDLTARGAKVLVLSHFGRPKGKRVPEMSLKPVADALSEMLVGTPVSFAPDCVGPDTEAAVSALGAGEILVLENLRFYAGEEANDEAFARALCRLGDLYVNDAFSCAHRAHASTEAIARLLPAYAGPLMCAEIEALQSALENPDRPVAAVVGGAKVSTKIPVLTNLTAKVDVLIVGGGMANTFLQAQGVDVGASLSEPNLADTARGIMDRAKAAGCEILLPVDAVVAEEFKAGAEAKTVPLDQVPSDTMILDVGPKTLEALAARLGSCKTLLWNGPLGAFEIDPFGAGTFALARQAAELTKQGNLVTVAGGGDTVAALNAATVTQDFTYVSTAGGAFLEWLEGKHLPGVKALEEAGAGQPFARSA